MGFRAEHAGSFLDATGSAEGWIANHASRPGGRVRSSRILHCAGGGDIVTKQKTLEDIKETFGFVPGFFEDFKWDELALSGGWELFKKFELSETNIPLKYKHLIALAAAGAVKCPYCTKFHTAAAELFGATETELQETAYTTSLVGYFSNYLHGRRYPLEKFDEELNHIVKNFQAAAAAGKP